MSNNDKSYQECAVCRSQGQHGPHVYEGRKAFGYEMGVCWTCYNASAHGWAMRYESKILALLKQKGIAPPPRNAYGLLPREF